MGIPETEGEADQYRADTHLIHFGLNPNLNRAGNRKPHSILSKAFLKSKRSRTRSYSLAAANSSDSWARKLLSRCSFPLRSLFGWA
jgi:hypothetical protein